MPANGNITIADGATTPVNHTFTPSGLDGAKGLAQFTERTDGVFVGEPKLDVTVRPVTKGQPTRKVVLLLTLPKRTTDVNGNVSVTYENLGKAEFTYSATSSTQERKNLRVLLSNAMINALVAQVVDNNETFW